MSIGLMMAGIAAYALDLVLARRALGWRGPDIAAMYGPSALAFMQFAGVAAFFFPAELLAASVGGILAVALGTRRVRPENQACISSSSQL